MTPRQHDWNFQLDECNACEATSKDIYDNQWAKEACSRVVGYFEYNEKWYEIKNPKDRPEWQAVGMPFDRGPLPVRECTCNTLLHGHLNNCPYPETTNGKN